MSARQSSSQSSVAPGRLGGGLSQTDSRTLKPKNYGDVASDIIQSGLEAALESGLDDDLKSRAHLERANDIADLSKWIQKIRDINSRNAKAS